MVALLDKTYSELSRRGKAVFIACMVTGYSAMAVFVVWVWIALIRWVASW